MPQAPHEPTEELQMVARNMAGHGIPVHLIAATMGICVQTLYNHYREEMNCGRAEIGLKVAKSLATKAIDGDVRAAELYLKCQMGWKDTSRKEIAGDPDNPVVQRVERVIVRPEESDK